MNFATAIRVSADDRITIVRWEKDFFPLYGQQMRIQFSESRKFSNKMVRKYFEEKKTNRLLL